ncbi:MAG: radical SAM protein [Flavonifractor plautii]
MDAWSVEHCYTSALEPFGVRYTAHEIFEIVRSDEMFYKSTGGGITIGGGECTCYPDFMLELTQLCHNSGIHVAVDTCGYTTSSKALEVLKAADLLCLISKVLIPCVIKKTPENPTRSFFKICICLARCASP